MLQGHVDEVSHRAIAGWAADDTRPDDTLDVSIFVNARKVAQVACDKPRQDLIKTGQYGHGNHGFAFRFPKPLPAGQEIRLSVRFSQSGSALTRGECLLATDGIRVLPPPDPVPFETPIMMPGPHDPRALLELLYWYDERLGLSPLLSRLDLAGFAPQLIHYTTFGELPQRPLGISANGRYYPHDHLNELLLSDEFQTGLLPLLLHAYDDKRRLIFVHIPKCAGTDLSNKLRTRYPWANVNIMDADWTSKDALLRHLSQLVLQLRFSDCIYLCGHARLDYYARNHLVRPADQIFTIIRDPAAIIISQVNYILTRFWLDAESGTIGPDTQHWLKEIDIEALPAKLSDGFVQDAGRRVLQNTDLVKPNSICYWLAGRDADARTALEGLVNQNVEVTLTGHYKDWLAQRWNIRSQSTDNSSMKFFTAARLPRDYRDYIGDITQEDAKLYQRIGKAIEQCGGVSVSGHELMRGLG
jgi:hypothetical protein